MRHLIRSLVLLLAVLLSHVGLPQSGDPDFEFQAHRVRDKVELKWIVAGYVNYFYIERSLDKESWDPILRMSGSNETLHKTEYFDIDYNVPSTKLFYRVKQVLYDGTSTSSAVYFVPALDDLSYEEEKLIKTIYDPITVGIEINLNFLSIKKHEELLLVLRDQCGDEFFAKVKYTDSDDIYRVTDVSGDIPSGQYLITASSRKEIYSTELRIELTD